MTFEQQIKIWLQQGKIKKQKPHLDQIRVLLEKAEKDIAVGNKVLEIDLETSFTLAYNSMLKAGRALVLSKGFRTDDGAQHKTTVDFCAFQVTKDKSDLIDIFDRMRRNRNTMTYDPFESSELEQSEVKDCLKAAADFLVLVKKVVQ